MLRFRVVHDHTSLSQMTDLDCFVFDFAILNPIDDYDGVFGDFRGQMKMN